MSRTFRPLLWNLVLGAVTALFTAIFVGIVFTENAPAARVVYGVLALAFAVWTVRILAQRVVVGDDGVVSHGMWRTVRVPWDAVADVAYRQVGERLLRTTYAPVLVLRRPLRGGGADEFVLDIVRSYPSSGATLASRTADAVRERLSRMS